MTYCPSCDIAYEERYCPVCRLEGLVADLKQEIEDLKEQLTKVNDTW